MTTGPDVSYVNRPSALSSPLCQRLPDVPAVGKVLLRHDYSPKESDPTQSVLRGSTKVAIAVNTCALMVLKELNEEAEEAVRLRGARPWRPT